MSLTIDENIKTIQFHYKYPYGARKKTIYGEI